MAAETRHAGLTADERSDIRSTVLDTRELIEDDLYRQLERYGVYEHERVDLEQLGHLNAYDRQTRRTIDAALDRELEATEGDYQRSVENYVREATKTYLNRLVALKAIEVRGLVTETLMDRPEYGNRSEMLRTVDEVAGELTDQQDGGQSAALELAYTELTDEIGVIFEESEHTAIDLDFAVREDVIEQLNEIDESVWESDEAMGWVYQYFGEKEREEIDDRIDEENYKVQDMDVATKTQLFTPRYIVEWMVDNSLGRLWLEMHGEQTKIDDENQSFYLAPLEGSLSDRDVKDVRDIKVLDPACGSGHMLFYAFDVLYEMYLEQADVAEKYIPREILRNNLYGIDIDDGAAQLAALSLYVKAKSKSPDVEIEGINIVSADAVLVNGEKKEEILERANSELEKKVLEQVWTSFEHIREWGSLVRIEEQIEDIIEEEIEEVESTGQAKFTQDGELAKQSSVVSFSDETGKSWGQIKELLLEKISELAEEALEENKPSEELFAEEVEKSVRLLDVFLGDFDVVVSNPPYLASAKMGENLKKYIKNNYLASRDLYTAFIERCTDFSNEDQYVTMVTPENFMFLKSYERLREYLISNYQFIEGMHLSRYGFAQAKDSYTIPFVLRNSNPDDFEYSRFYRMTHEQKKYEHYEDKISGLTEITSANRNQNLHNDVYVVDQNAFQQIQRTPIVYWFGKDLLQLFVEYPVLSDLSTIKSGLVTGDNAHHLRKYWEVPEEWIGEDYHWQVDNGEGRSYYDLIDTLVRWINRGKNIEEYAEKHGKNIQGLTDSQPYFEEGVVFRNFSKAFTAKYFPDDCIYNKSVYHVSPEGNIGNNILLAYMNSNLYRFLAQGINPTLNFNPSDAGAVVLDPEFDFELELRDLVDDCIDKRVREISYIETAREYNPDNYINEDKVSELVSESLYEIDSIKAEIQILHSRIDQIIYDEFGVGSDDRERMNEEYSADVTQLPLIFKDEVPELSGELSFLDKIPQQIVTDDEYHSQVRELNNKEIESIESAAEDLKISPYSIAYLRYTEDLYTLDEKRRIVKNLLSYCMGGIFGRWNNLSQLEPVDGGILAFDGTENDLTARIRHCLKLVFTDPYEAESEIEEILNKNISDWFQNNFFRYHHCKEYRRRGQRIPIYWHLESDNGAFSCFMYYHAMDADTFPKLRGQYIDKKIDTLQNRLEAIESELDTTDGDRARELRSEKEDIKAEIDEITEFRDRVDDLIDEGFEPDFGAGIWENIQKVDEHDLLAVPLDKL